MSLMNCHVSKNRALVIGDINTHYLTEKSDGTTSKVLALPHVVMAAWGNLDHLYNLAVVSNRYSDFDAVLKDAMAGKIFEPTLEAVERSYRDAGVTPVVNHAALLVGYSDERGECCAAFAMRNLDGVTLEVRLITPSGESTVAVPMMEGWRPPFKGDPNTPEKLIALGKYQIKAYREMDSRLAHRIVDHPVIGGGLTLAEVTRHGIKLSKVWKEAAQPGSV